MLNSYNHSSNDSYSSSSDEDDQIDTNYNVNKPIKKKLRISIEKRNNLTTLEQVPSLRSVDKERIYAQRSKLKVIILLDQASLDTVKNKRGIFELINCDDHIDICKKINKNARDFRPDICHQELLTLLDSPLNKFGSLQVYIRSSKNILIQVDPSLRIPRTFKRFSGLMVQLLYKMKVKAKDSSKTLIKLIKNPFSQYLPCGTRCYGLSSNGTLYNPYQLARSILPQGPYYLNNGVASPPTCFIVGSMARGSISTNDHPYIEQMYSISEYPLSGSTALSRLLCGIEHNWGIV